MTSDERTHPVPRFESSQEFWCPFARALIASLPITVKHLASLVEALLEPCIGITYYYYLNKIPADTRRPLRAPRTEDVKDTRHDQAETRSPRDEEDLFTPCSAPRFTLA